MLSIGWLELLVILLAALIFLKPEEIPVLFRKFGKLYAKGQRASAALLREMNRVDDYIKTESQTYLKISKEKKEGISEQDDEKENKGINDQIMVNNTRRKTSQQKNKKD